MWRVVAVPLGVLCLLSAVSWWRGSDSPEKIERQYLAACGRANPEGIRAALRSGAEVDAVTHGTLVSEASGVAGETCLHLLVYAPSLRSPTLREFKQRAVGCARIVDEAGIDFNLQAADGATALHRALRHPSPNWPALAYLFRESPRRESIHVSIRDDSGFEPRSNTVFKKWCEGRF